MSTLRWSGEIRIRITYLEKATGKIMPDGRIATMGTPNGKYRCYLITTENKVPERETIIVGAPTFLSHAVDSPRAFDEAAKAALAFACNDSTIDWSAYAAFDDDGYFVSRSAPKGPRVSQEEIDEVIDYAEKF